jgi:hypothetical protein
MMTVLLSDHRCRDRHLTRTLSGLGRLVLACAESERRARQEPDRATQGHREGFLDRSSFSLIAAAKTIARPFFPPSQSPLYLPPFSPLQRSSPRPSCPRLLPPHLLLPLRRVRCDGCAHSRWLESRPALQKARPQRRYRRRGSLWEIDNAQVEWQLVVPRTTAVTVLDAVCVVELAVGGVPLFPVHRAAERERLEHVWDAVASQR